MTTNGNCKLQRRVKETLRNFCTVVGNCRIFKYQMNGILIDHHLHTALVVIEWIPARHALRPRKWLSMEHNIYIYIFCDLGFSAEGRVEQRAYHREYHSRLTAWISWRPVILQMCSMVIPPFMFVCIFHTATAPSDTRAQRSQGDFSWLSPWKLLSDEHKYASHYYGPKFCTRSNECFRRVLGTFILYYGG